MSEITEKEFLDILTNVIEKLSNIAKTQRYRFQQKWEEILGHIEVKPHLIRQILFEKEKFIKDNEYKLKTLKTVSNAFIDGYYAIKSLLEALYLEYFNSAIFKKMYPQQDQLKIKYIVAKEVLGNLIQYNKMDYETIPLKYNIIARNYTLLKFNIKTDEAILKNMNKIFRKTPLSLEKIHSIIEEIQRDGLISITEENNQYSYKLESTLELSPEGNILYDENLAQLITWATNLWRSFYNIRELNITPSQPIPHHEFLSKILSHSSTQGFSSANYVFTNLIKYFEMVA